MNRSTKTMAISLLLMLFVPTAKLSAQVSVWDGTHEEWTHGTGTEADPFLIENAQQLAYLAHRVNNGLDANGGHVSNHNYHYKLMVDVNLNGRESFQWTPIGYYNSNTDYQCFGGQFDGNNHTVSGLYINSSAIGVGFFARTEGATIKNLSVNGTKVSTSGSNAGGVVGAVNSTVIMNCSTGFTDGVSTPNCAGGVVGVSVSTSTITNCHNIGNVSASNYSGGILGIGEATLTNCYNTGVVSGSNYSGGVLGHAGTATITNCYNTGAVSGSNCSGGVLGYAGTATIANCYNTGNISGSSSGGIVGQKNNGTVINSYYLNTCGGNNTYGGQSMSSDAMKTEEFVDILNDGACSWVTDNTNMNNGYPILTMYSARTYQATAVGATTATLHGSIYIENTSVTSKGFEYKKIGDEEYSTITISDNMNYFSYYLDGLVENTMYEYRTFLNVDNCDHTSYGTIKTFEVTWLNQDTINIYDSDMLRWVSEQCNSGTTFEGKCIKLINDITLPLNVPNNMTSIGSYPHYPFKGTFDGNGKLITNLYIDQPNTPYQGFFGYTLNANLYNVGLVNITASGRNYTGGMVAYAANTNMRDCYVNGGTLFALSYCGGLVGYQDQGTNSIISGCYNTCEVTGNNYVGGLIGFSNYSTVRNSYVASMVAAQGEAVGAIIGGANEVLMYNCYFNAELTGQTNAIGWNNTGKDGGESMTSAQMRDPQFVATLNQGLSTPVWKADYAVPINKGFPILKWQGLGTIVNENNSVGCTISPNPTNGKVTIEAENLKHISISNMLGQTVYDGDAIGNAFEYDFSKYKMGIYLIRIETASGVATKRVVVTR